MDWKNGKNAEKCGKNAAKWGIKWHLQTHLNLRWADWILIKRYSTYSSIVCLNWHKHAALEKKWKKCGKMRHQAAPTNTFELEISRLDCSKELQYIQWRSVLELAQECRTGKMWQKCGKNAAKCGIKRHQVAPTNTFELEISRLDCSKELQYIQWHSVLELAQECHTGKMWQKCGKNAAKCGIKQHQVAPTNTFELEISRLDCSKESQYIQWHSVLELEQACRTGKMRHQAA